MKVLKTSFIALSPRASSTGHELLLRLLRRVRGFNLVEAAIVLGITGLIIGGIFVAVSAVREKTQINAIATGILRIYQGLPNLGIRQIPASTPITQLIISNGLVANDWMIPTGNWAPLPIQTAEWGVTFYPLPNARVDFDLLTLPDVTCRQLALALGQAFRSYSGVSLLVRVVNWGAGTSYTTFPIDPSSLPETCQQLKLIVPIFN